MAAGKRDRKIEFQRFAAVEDGYGGQDREWAHYAYAWAKIRYGTGQERRDAAREASSVVATFQVLANSATRSLTTADRISFEGFWDITSAVPNGRGLVDVTAIRSDQGEENG